MAEFAAEFRPPFPLLEIDPTTMEQQIPHFTDHLNHFDILQHESHTHHNSNNDHGSSHLVQTFHSFINSSIPTTESFFTAHQMLAPELALTVAETYPHAADDVAFHHHQQNYMNVVEGHHGGGLSSSSSVPFHQFPERCGSRKRKMAAAESCSMNVVSPQASESGNKRRNGSRKGGGKRVRSKEDQAGEGCEMPKEVVHVRARRGQATDSHSLAERVRRGKINERLRCLQNIVPGCYKTMGMSVMLDEIINYVQSLQNQVEFLSMKLTAASTFYDFNAETEAIETLQWAKVREAREEGRVMKEGYDGGFSCFHSTWSL